MVQHYFDFRILDLFMNLDLEIRIIRLGLEWNLDLYL